MKDKRISFIFLFCVLAINGFTQRVIKGRVVDQQTNSPISGASITTTNSRGVATDNKGYFGFTSDANVLTVSSIGYITQQFKLPATGDALILLQPSNTALNEVIVEGNANNEKILQAPDAIGLVTARDLQRTSGIHLHQALNIIPGVKMEIRTTTSGARIVLRGYGNETNFNGAGYKAYLNGIPITDADGTTFLDDIDFFNLGRVEVIKGPASSLYGNTIGGVVLMQMQKAEPGETSVGQQITGGAYGLFRTNTSYKAASDNANIFVNYGHQQYEGFRFHSSSKKDFINLGGDFYLSNKRTISAFASYTKSFDYLAGQVDSNYLYLHPDSASSDYLANDAHVNTENVRLSVAQDYHFSSIFANNTSIFLTGTTLDQPSAAGLSRTEKFKFGGRSVFTYSPTVGNLPLKFSFGSEFIKNKNYAKSYALVNNILGAMRADQEITVSQYNFFLQAEAQVTTTTTLTIGAGENFLEYELGDLIASRPSTSPQGIYKNQSGYKRFQPLLSPKIAIDQIINKDIAVYANVSKGFSSPTVSQVIIVPTGATLNTQDPQFNTNLKPEAATSYELGSKGSLVNKRLSYDVSVFLMDVKDKLVTEYYGGNSYTFTNNVGNARHKGVEVSLSYAKTFGDERFFSLLKPFISYTYSDFRYVNYQNIPQGQATKQNFSGYQIPGTVKNLFNAGLDVESNPGFYLNMTFMYVDKMPVLIDKNMLVHYANAYHLLNGKLGYRKKISSHFNIDIFAGMDNMTGAVYATHIFLNSRDYPKIYNPMPGETWYAGGSLKYIF